MLAAGMRRKGARRQRLVAHLFGVFNGMSAHGARLAREIKPVGQSKTAPACNAAANLKAIDDIVSKLARAGAGAAQAKSVTHVPRRYAP